MTMSLASEAACELLLGIGVKTIKWLGTAWSQTAAYSDTLRTIGSPAPEYLDGDPAAQATDEATGWLPAGLLAVGEEDFFVGVFVFVVECDLEAASWPLICPSDCGLVVLVGLRGMAKIDPVIKRLNSAKMTRPKRACLFKNPTLTLSLCLWISGTKA